MDVDRVAPFLPISVMSSLSLRGGGDVVVVDVPSR